MKNTYKVTGEAFSLIDPELKLHIESTLVLVKVPHDIKKTAKIDKNTSIQVEKDDKGHVHSAFATHHGIKHGQELTFYSHHKIKTETYYKNGILHGPSTSYGEDGTLLSQTWFVDGKKEGKSEWFYEDGAVYAIQRFRNGENQGKQEYYYPDGTAKTLMYYKEGKLDGNVVIYSKSGQIEREITYINGVAIKKEKEVPQEVFKAK